MRQVFRLLAATIFPIACAFLMTACENAGDAFSFKSADDVLLFKNVGDPALFESDQTLGEDRKTTDIIEDENTELIALGTLQSTLFAHQNSALYNFLDASDLPAGSDENGTLICSNASDEITATVAYDFSRSALDTQGNPSAHKVGDTISVTYDNCSDGRGAVYNGTLSARYSEIRGLNETFVEVDTDYCVATLQEELSISSSDVIDVSGHEVRFTQVGDAINVQVVETSVVSSDESEQQIDTIVDTFFVPITSDVLIVNSRVSTSDTAITSIDGDQVYSLVDGQYKEEACQRYERTLSATLTGFSTDKDNLLTTLDGTVELLLVSDNLSTVDASIQNSSFTTTVEQGELTEIFSMSDYTVSAVFNSVAGVYRYELSGYVTSDALFGTVQLVTQSQVNGNLSEKYPFVGTLRVLGVELEQIWMTIKGQEIELSVDYNGDTTGNGMSDNDKLFSTTWDELIARDFQEP